MVRRADRTLRRDRHRRGRALAATTVLLTLLALLPAAALATPAAAAPTGAGAAAAPPAAGAAAAPTPDPIAHDPTLIKEGRYYYDIITGDIGTRTYLPIRRSTDLVHWTFLGTVFSTPPAWVVAELGLTPGDFWAPDITYFNGAYHLYYAASSFGTNNSVIGLATTTTLDPASPDYAWVDRGMVLRSRSSTDDFNAIDPDVVFDAGGVPWLSFGSFWDGIKMRRLDAATGGLAAADPTLYSLASRGGASIEGPSIVRRGGFYYLFVSFDFCCRGVNADYRMVVGRSTRLTGPYLDADGVPMLAGGGTELLRGYGDFRGTGGGDVYRRGTGDLLVHHYYDRADGGLPRLSVRPLSWVDGWPRVGDPLSGNRTVGHGGAYFAVVERASGTVVTNSGCGYEGADIRLADRADNPCQLWRFEERGGGYASVLNKFSNKVAEVAACVNADGARVAQWGWLNNDCQEFRVVGTDGGWSRLENKLAGRVLTAAACGGAGAPVQTVAWGSSACQQFRLDPVGDILLADAAGQRVLDVAGCGRSAGAVVVTAARRGDCQLWRFQPSTEGFYRIVHRRSGRPRALSHRLGDAALLVLGRAGGDGSGGTARAGEWRIEPRNDGSYLLVNRADGTVIDPTGRLVRQRPATGDPGQAVQLLVP